MLKPTPPSAVKGLGHNGHSGENGHSGRAGAGDPTPAGPDRPRRNSIFPFLLDLGVVLALFGLVIIRPVYSELAGNVALGAGIILALAALGGWVREARAEYTRTPD